MNVDHQVQMEGPERRVVLVNLDREDQLDPRENQVFPDKVEREVHLVKRVDKEKVGNVVHQVLLELLDQLVLPDLQEKVVNVVKVALLEKVVLLELLDVQVQSKVLKNINT